MQGALGQAYVVAVYTPTYGRRDRARRPNAAGVGGREVADANVADIGCRSGRSNAMGPGIATPLRAAIRGDRSYKMHEVDRERPVRSRIGVQRHARALRAPPVCMVGVIRHKNGARNV